jgi:hypothetical protein
MEISGSTDRYGAVTSTGGAEAMASTCDRSGLGGLESVLLAVSHWIKYGDGLACGRVFFPRSCSIQFLLFFLFLSNYVALQHGKYGSTQYILKYMYFTG